jgi:hypothetical protein
MEPKTYLIFLEVAEYFVVEEGRCQVKQFEERYGMNVDTFQRKVEAHVNEEDFQQEEDLMVWRVR